MPPEPASSASSAGASAPPLDRAAERHSAPWSLVAGMVALLVLLGAAALWSGALDRAASPTPTPTPSTDAGPAARPAVIDRDDAVAALLRERASAVLAGDRSAFLASVDPSVPEFARAQRQLIRRLDQVPVAAWSYRIVGEGPGLPDEVAAGLPGEAAILRVRLTYRLAGTETETDREQYLTVVPRGGRWLLAGDTDAEAADLRTQRDLWDLGPVLTVRGSSSLVVGDASAAGRKEMRRLAEEADVAVADVGRVWNRPWSRRPVVLLPASQQDMATLIGSDGRGLAQIAAVTTGAFEDGLSRGDRVVVNPATFATLGPMGRRVVLAHEMTHVATRATAVSPVPIWLSEGFADYVAYDATSLPLGVVASDVLDDVRNGNGPRRLPDDADFDAGQGDIAAAYEGAWLACRMVAERYGEERLVLLYDAVSDSAGPGWPEEVVDVLGVTAEQLVRQWRDYLAAKAVG